MRRLAAALVLVALVLVVSCATAAAETVTIGSSLSEASVLLGLCTKCTVFQSAAPGATIVTARLAHVAPPPRRKHR